MVPLVRPNSQWLRSGASRIEASEERLEGTCVAQIECGDFGRDRADDPGCSCAQARFVAGNHQDGRAGRCDLARSLEADAVAGAGSRA